MQKPPAFSLVEVAMALGVAAFALLVIVGLFPTGISAEKHAAEQTAVTSVMNSLSTDLISAGKNNQNSTSHFGLSLDSDRSWSNPLWIDESGSSTTGPNTARYRVTTRIDQQTGPHPRLALVRITWPAMAPQNAVEGFVETIVAIPRE